MNLRETGQKAERLEVTTANLRIIVIQGSIPGPGLVFYLMVYMNNLMESTFASHLQS